jgi:hypothetical protein
MALSDDKDGIYLQGCFKHKYYHDCELSTVPTDEALNTCSYLSHCTTCKICTTITNYHNSVKHSGVKTITPSRYEQLRPNKSVHSH